MSDPSESDDIEPGDILVARTTDPSWAPVMFLAAAAVTITTREVWPRNFGRT